MQTVAEVVSSGLVPRLIPRLDLNDLQSLMSVNRALRNLLDSLAEPDWTAARARIVQVATTWLTWHQVRPDQRCAHCHNAEPDRAVTGIALPGRHQAICRYFTTQHAITTQQFATL